MICIMAIVLWRHCADWWRTRQWRLGSKFVHSFIHKFVHSPFSLCRNCCSSAWCVLLCEVSVRGGGHTADVLRDAGWGHPGCLSGQISMTLPQIRKVRRTKILV